MDNKITLTDKEIQEIQLELNLSPSWRKKKRTQGIWKTIISLLAFSFGTIGTIITLNSDTGGFIYWGAIVFGFIGFVNGLGQTIEFRKLVVPVPAPNSKKKANTYKNPSGVTSCSNCYEIIPNGARICPRCGDFLETD